MDICRTAASGQRSLGLLEIIEKTIDFSLTFRHNKIMIFGRDKNEKCKK